MVFLFWTVCNVNNLSMLLRLIHTKSENVIKSLTCIEYKKLCCLDCTDMTGREIKKLYLDKERTQNICSAACSRLTWLFFPKAQLLGTDSAAASLPLMTISVTAQKLTGLRHDIPRSGTSFSCRRSLCVCGNFALLKLRGGRS